MNEDQIRKIIQDEMGKSQYNVAPTSYHAHTRIDSPAVDMSNISHIVNPHIGDIPYWAGTSWDSLSLGTTGTVVTSSGTIPIYAPSGGGGGGMSLPVGQAGMLRIFADGFAIPDSTPTKIVDDGGDPFFIFATDLGTDITADEDNGRFILNTSGTYLLACAMTYSLSGTTIADKQYEMDIYVNRFSVSDPSNDGSNYQPTFAQSSINSKSLTLAATVFLSLGSDGFEPAWVSLYANQTSGSTQNVSNATLSVSKISSLAF